MVQVEIRARLTEQRAQEEAKRVARDLADRIGKMGKPSDDQLRRLTAQAVTFNESEYLGRADVPSGLGAPAFTRALFTLQPGEVHEPVSTPRGEAIVKLADIKKPGTPTFAEVKSRVIADLAKKKQEEETGAAVKAAMTPGATIEEVAGKLGAKVETPESFGQGGTIGQLGNASALVDAAFAAKPGELNGPVSVPDRGVVVFKLLDKTPFDQAAFDAQKLQIKDSLRNQKGMRLMQALIARRRGEMKIVTNRELLARVAS